jgi:hypothetical protein
MPYISNINPFTNYGDLLLAAFLTVASYATANDINRGLLIEGNVIYRRYRNDQEEEMSHFILIKSCQAASKGIIICGYTFRANLENQHLSTWIIDQQPGLDRIIRPIEIPLSLGMAHWRKGNKKLLSKNYPSGEIIFQLLCPDMTSGNNALNIEKLLSMLTVPCPTLITYCQMKEGKPPLDPELAVFDLTGPSYGTDLYYDGPDELLLFSDIFSSADTSRQSDAVITATDDTPTDDTPTDDTPTDNTPTDNTPMSSTGRPLLFSPPSVSRPRPLLLTPPAPIAMKNPELLIPSERLIIKDIVVEHVPLIQVQIDILSRSALMPFDILAPIAFFRDCITTVENQIDNKIKSFPPSIIVSIDLSVVTELKQYLHRVSKILNDTELHTTNLIQLVADNTSIRDVINVRTNQMTNMALDQYFFNQLDTPVAYAIRIQRNVQMIIDVFQWVISN